MAAWEKSQESAIKRKNYRNDKNNKEFFDKLDLIEKTLNNILDSDTNVTNELVNKRIYEIVYAEQIATEKERAENEAKALEEEQATNFNDFIAQFIHECETGKRKRREELQIYLLEQSKATKAFNHSLKRIRKQG